VQVLVSDTSLGVLVLLKAYRRGTLSDFVEGLAALESMFGADAS
jgi:hypothetical protein